MRHPFRVFVFSLVALAAVASLASSQAYPCIASGGTNCRALIPDYNQGTTPLNSAITVTPVGPCASLPVSRVLVSGKILHDWQQEVGITLINPAATQAVWRSGTWQDGLDYPVEDYEIELAEFPSLTGGSAAGAWTLRLNDIDNSGYGALDDWTLYLVCGAIPSVTISAPDDQAIENPLSTGAYRITRSVVTAAPMEVQLLYSGTASAGDYVALPATVTIPADQASVDLTVTPNADPWDESPETVIATLGSSPLYDVGSPSAATVTILDEPVTPIPLLDPAGLAALMALLALVGAWPLRSRHA